MKSVSNDEVIVLTALTEKARMTQLIQIEQRSASELSLT